MKDGPAGDGAATRARRSRWPDGPGKSIEPPREEAGWFEGDRPIVERLDSRGMGPGGALGSMTYLEAINAALDDELASDERVVLLGEDIGVMGGAFRVTRGLCERHGDRRVVDTPMAETALVGAAIGLAVSGLRPIVELQFADFISCAYDQLVTEAAKLHYRFGISVPLVVRAPSGAGVGAGPFHSQSPEGVFAHIPGLKVVCPGTVQDAYDLLRAAVADPNPVLYFEHKALYRSLRDDAVSRRPGGELGSAVVRRIGSDLSLVTYGGMLPRCLDVAEAFAAEGVDIEVVDLRTVSPLDMVTVSTSVRKTGRAVVVHEDTRSSGIGAEVVARMAEDEFFALDAPILRCAAPDTPVPFALTLEQAYVPAVERITQAVRQCLRT
jgi:2-oxoisovalerate dehydrogenase E1 component beta subunit